MRKILFILTLAGLVTACSANSGETAILGSDRDAHSCISSAGYRYSMIKQSCIQPFAIADIKLTDPNDNTLALYVILSEDRQKAEIFSASKTKSTLFEAVKGGYVSQDGKVRLINQRQIWKITK
ncbi:hypothetical protein F542_1990 [Bibersteinia trehalosi USDA-ARS-USMARC-188]|uniref:Lipoprotein n=2 Tax=Bibersteinia trehalosi TaxID=47735 RepID=A0A4V7I7C3_BIBTR|nr:hypothetical protein [Bibersteinia trehalosi]AGH39336.1 hypothetical protein WQG_20590 [Bibersteinia trehalosi USDA-ARS-USMARC-192]AHG80917.1 hypothetical protein F542_1990 [Bibersteinia trehalosi USDA-ARS-USMARC-188]AHG83130.1 hypothetical protein F543_2660 [Bibersteinia trehalosi USDA-ARS-USMARC-189]